MAGNDIDLVSKFLEIIDAVYKAESLTARLDALTQSVDYAGANEIKVMKLTTVGLGTYSRAAGYPAGDITAAWETMKLTAERGRAFSLDRMDNEETLGLVMGNLIREWMRVHVAPELDAYRFAAYATAAGNSVSAAAALSTGKAVLDAIDAGIAALDEDEAPTEGRILYIASGLYHLLKGVVTRTLATETGVQRNVFMLDDMPVIPVPQARFISAVSLNAGSTSDVGGFTKDGSAHDLNFLILHPSAVLQPVKLNNVKYFAPDTNQISDGHLWQYRLYHDAFVYDNRANGIYRHDKNSARGLARSALHASPAAGDGGGDDGCVGADDAEAFDCGAPGVPRGVAVTKGLGALADVADVGDGMALGIAAGGA